MNRDHMTRSVDQALASLGGDVVGVTAWCMSWVTAKNERAATRDRLLAEQKAKRG